MRGGPQEHPDPAGDPRQDLREDQLVQASAQRVGEFMFGFFCVVLGSSCSCVGLVRLDIRICFLFEFLLFVYQKNASSKENIKGKTYVSVFSIVSCCNLCTSHGERICLFYYSFPFSLNKISSITRYTKQLFPLCHCAMS